jgi:hypothetical protein
MEKPTTDELKKLVDELLKATHLLAESYPDKTNEFLKVLVGIYRKNTFTLISIRYLANQQFLSDSALDLARNMIEDTISVEYMIAIDKEKMAKRFQRYLWVQLHQVTEFMKTIGQDASKNELQIDVEKVEKEYQAVKKEFTHYSKAGESDLRSWIGKDIETLMKELYEKKALNEFDTSRSAIGYVYGCWKNHLNPYDIAGYLDNETHEVGRNQAIRQALVFGATCLIRLTTRYIDEIRYACGENKHQNIGEKVIILLNKMDKMGK